MVAARQNKDIAAAAAKGTSPWKLAQLSACICLWDLLWLPASTSSTSVPMDLSVTRDHVQRAFTCLEMLEGFGNVLAGLEADKTWMQAPAELYTDNSDELLLQGKLQDTYGGAEDETLRKDVNFDPAVPQKTGLKDQTIARRIMQKAVPDKSRSLQKDADQRFATNSRSTWGLFSAKEQTKMTQKLCVGDFRLVAKAVPEEIGEFMWGTDSLHFKLPRPQDISKEDPIHNALKDFANITLDALWKDLSAKQADETKERRGEKAREAAREAKKRKKTDSKQPDED